MNWFKTAIIVNGLVQLGDLFSTIACMAWVGGHEANPIVVALMTQFGIGGLIGLKIFVGAMPLLLFSAPERLRVLFSKILLVAMVPTVLAVLNNTTLLLLHAHK